MWGIDNFLFDQINIALLFVAFLNLGLGFIIYFSGRKRIINRVYFINILAIISWTLAMFFFRSALESGGLLWCKILYITPTLVASSFLCFTYIFPSKTEHNAQKKCIFFLFINFLLIILIIAPNFIVSDVNISYKSENEIIFGPFYFLYFIYTLFFFSFGFWRLFRKYLKVQGIERSQILYLFIGYALAANLAFVTNLIMPWLGYFFLNWLGQIFTVFMVAFTAYAILRYRLMDIRIVARRAFIYFGVTLFAYIFFYSLAWFYQNIFDDVFSRSSYIASIFIAPIFVLFFYGADKGLKVVANKYLFFSLYNYQETINKLTDELNHYMDLDKIINLIVDTIKKTMQLDRTGILLVNSDKKPAEYQIAKVIGFNRRNGISLVQDNFLTQYLEKNQKPLVSDEIMILAQEAKTAKERENFVNLQKHMKKIEASLCLPIRSGKKLIGIIVLGPKISKDGYTQEDLELLNILSKQAGIAIDNAQLYQKVENFNQTLKQKIEEQTRNLRETNKELLLQNKLNKELLEMKSDFLRVVNHQLNTPLSVMSGYFSMLKEGSYKAEQALPAIEQGLKRINQTVSDFWDAYEIEGEKMRMEPQKTDITGIVDKLIQEKKDMPLAQKRKLKIKTKKADFKIPLVWCDPKRIAHVISNLLDNAVFYTDKGSVIVSYEKAGEDYLKIKIKDTGAGISKDDVKKLFQKFSRGQKASGLHPDGSGLGLYISRKIVESNGGELNFFSKGEGHGTTFDFTLPLYKNQKSVKQTGDEVFRGKKIEIF